MADFKKQILEDIDDYQSRLCAVEHIDNAPWAFNFWVLDKLFSIDEDLIEEQIVDYNDKGIDCFVWHEDLHDLYLIQNKFYEEGNNITIDYFFNDFLTRAIGALEKGTYKRSPALQEIYSKYHDEPDFDIHFQLYITNNSSKYPDLIKKIEEYNAANVAQRKEARLFSLNDIEELYFKGPNVEKKSFTYKITTINKGTILNIDNAAYNMHLAADGRFTLTPVTLIYRLLKEAKAKGYALFEENIREYLGSNGSVNKKIVDTLKDPQERNNFFFYNNGITIIVDNYSSVMTEGNKRSFTVTNPQIVNGCQTVNTIFETLNSLPESKLEKDFEDTFVMVKILKIPSNDDNLKELYRNIVTYNNSQNAINERAFAAAASEFKRIQAEFENKGFLIAIKQSDKHKFSKEYPKATTLITQSSVFQERFGLQLKKTKDFTIDLEKLLQVFLAFVSKPVDAIQNKSKLLKVDSTQNRVVIDFIRNPEVTAKDMVFLLLLYWRAELVKKNSDDKKSPNPFYLVNWFANYECNSNPANISSVLNSPEAVNKIIKKYTAIFQAYYKAYTEKYPGKDYNTMIKSQIDDALLETSKSQIEYILSLNM